MLDHPNPCDPEADDAARAMKPRTIELTDGITLRRGADGAFCFCVTWDFFATGRYRDIPRPDLETLRDAIGELLEEEK